jgi:hypothetical protein
LIPTSEYARVNGVTRVTEAPPPFDTTGIRRELSINQACASA